MAELEPTGLRATTTFAAASDAQLAALARDMTVVDLQPGEVLLAHGTVSDQVHVVLSGTLAADLPTDLGTRRVAEFEDGEVIGEIAALTGEPRTATVMALTAAKVGHLPASAFARLLAAAPEVGRHLETIAHGRLRRNRLTSLLATIFPEVPDQVLAALVDAVEWVPLDAGASLLHDGEAADAAYLLVSGRLHALRRGHDGTQVLQREIVAGELLGEQALVDQGRWTETIRAARRCEVARLSRPAFLELVRHHPSAALDIARISVRRADGPERPPTTTETIITLVPVHEGIDLDGLAERLAPVMARHARLAHVSGASAAASLGNPGIGDAEDDDPRAIRLLRWLDELEEGHDQVMLQADHGVTPWTRRAVGLAEHVVVVADASRPPGLTEVERWLAAARRIHPPRRSLVLLHPPGRTRPTGTAAWLEPREVDRHHHLRSGVDGDIERLARHLAGAAVGLVLSGGGARGFGHLGVVRAMREQGIPIDAVIGSSVGAVLGARVACDDTDAAGLVAAMARAFTSVMNYTLPVAGLVTGRGISVNLAREFGTGARLEDLAIPFLGVSTDLTHSAVAVHRRGDLQRVLRASVAIPGVIPPVVIDGSLHVDGGVMDNLPVRIGRDEVRTGTVIAVDASPVEGLSVEDFGLSVSGWRQLADRLLPGRRPRQIPSLATTALRSMLVTSVRGREEALTSGLADLSLQLHPLPCGLLEFDTVAEVAEAGYEASHEAVAAFAAAHGQLLGTRPLDASGDAGPRRRP